MSKPITVNLDPDMHETVQSLPPTLTLTDLLLIQILRELQKAHPTEHPAPSASPTPPVAVTPATEPTT